MSENLAVAMLRCRTCAAWWSSCANLTVCPCGGDLATADMDAHNARLPRKPYDGARDPKPASKTPKEAP